MKREIIYSIAFLVLVSGFLGYVFLWEYTNQLGIFENFQRTRVITFDYSHQQEDGRQLVSVGNGVFWCDSSWDWVEVGVPYRVTWHYNTVLLGDGFTYGASTVLDQVVVA